MHVHVHVHNVRTSVRTCTCIRTCYVYVNDRLFMHHVAELMGSTSLKKLLHVILITGNFINGVSMHVHLHNYTCTCTCTLECFVDNMECQQYPEHCVQAQSTHTACMYIWLKLLSNRHVWKEHAAQK